MQWFDAELSFWEAFMSSPKISVVVPIFNVGDVLARCLDSLVNQTLSNIEIICVNDCSPDHSSEILAAYAKNDSRVVVLTHDKNMKTAAARNSGLRIARGEYVAFCDGDDFVELDFYEKLYGAAKMQGADICKGATKEFRIEGNIIVHENNIEVRANKFNFIWHHWSAIYRREVLEKNNIRFVVDCICFQIQAVYFANDVATVSDAFYCYVRREGSCESDVFSLEKWQQLNLAGADFVLDFINSVEIDQKNYFLLLCNVVFPLYFYGFNRLKWEDIPSGAKILRSALENGVAKLKYNDELKKICLLRYSRERMALCYKQYARGSCLYWINKIKYTVQSFVYRDYISEKGIRKIKVCGVLIFKKTLGDSYI